MKEILEAAGKSFFRELSEHVAKKASETLVVETTKAMVEVVKRRIIRRDEFDFAEWKKEAQPEKPKTKGKEAGEKAKAEDGEKEDPKDATPGTDESSEEGEGKAPDEGSDDSDEEAKEPERGDGEK